MARYFFHLSNGLTLEDTEGENFDLLAQARGHALQVAKGLGRGSLTGMAISVTDEQGVVVFQDANSRQRIGRHSWRPPYVFKTKSETSAYWQAAVKKCPFLRRRFPFRASRKNARNQVSIAFAVWTFTHRGASIRRGLSFMETDHEEAQYRWDCLWRGVVDGSASLDSMVARKERGGIP